MSQSPQITLGNSESALGIQDSSLSFLARVGLGAVFLVSGLAKIADPSATLAQVQLVGLPAPHVVLAAVTAVELAGSLMLIAGYRIRQAALALAWLMFATAFLFHSHFADQVQFLQFFKNMAIAGGLLQVAESRRGRLTFGAHG